MQRQPWEDCDRERKAFYSPLDVAIRWCGLTKEESRIAPLLSETWRVQRGELPQYPCLAIHSEAIEHAFSLGQLPYGRDGRSVVPGDNVAVARRTVSHADLKEWLRKEYPADVRKPHMAWLFDDVERSVHQSITVEAYESLKAERDGLKRLVEESKRRTSPDRRESDARLKAVAGLIEACGLDIHKGTAASLRQTLENVGYTVSADTCERMLNDIRTRMPFWQD